jgi:hypothetical protein
MPPNSTQSDELVDRTRRPYSAWEASSQRDWMSAEVCSERILVKQLLLLVR